MRKQLIAVAAVALVLTGVADAKKKPTQTATSKTSAATETPAATSAALPVKDAASAKAEPAQTKAAHPNSSQALESVLNKMDEAAAGFRSVETNFVWDQYQKVVDETDTQKGLMYFRRSGNNTEMAADISDPDKKYVLFTDGQVQVYQPKIDQVTKYNAGKNKAEFESFLVLGFGGRGHDLAKSFDVQYAGTENVSGINAAKLELTPRAAKVKGMFSNITLWIDPARGVSVQQRFTEPSGDYRLAKYSNIKMNQKVPDNAFKLKTTGKTRVVTPNS